MVTPQHRLETTGDPKKKQQSGNSPKQDKSLKIVFSNLAHVVRGWAGVVPGGLGGRQGD